MNDLSYLSSLDTLSGGYDYDSLNTYKNKIESKNFEESLLNAQKSSDEKQLKKACVEFESYFLKMMLSSMKDTIDTSDSFIPKSNGEKIFEDMLYEEYADRAANSGNGIGLAQSLYKQLSANLKKPDNI